MKTERIYLGLLLLFVVLFAGCSEETLGPNTGSGGGDEQEVRLQIRVFDEKGLKPRADETQGLQGNEGTINGNRVWIYVYDVDGKLETSIPNVELVEDTNNKKMVTFKLKTGDKFLYVFANPISGQPINAPSTRAEFERQIINVSFNETPNPPIHPNLTGDSYLMGTLWPHKITVKKRVDPDVDNQFIANIGRLAAKVKLWKVNGNNPTYSNMKGVFTNPRYSIGSIQKETFLVGQLQNPDGIQPPDPKHDVVISAVHDEPGSGGVNTPQNPVFTNYYDDASKFIGIDANTNITDLTNFFYIVENTTAYDDNDYQYYGNTTYIRLETVYEPHADEVHNPADLSPKGSKLAGTTFWTCMFDGKRYITDGEPTRAGVTNLVEYVDGKNYHFFPIMDERDEDTPNDLIIYSVLRNHYYEIEVTGIKDLGVGKNKEDPWIPIPKVFDVDVEVKVVDWSKISQSTGI